METNKHKGGSAFLWGIILGALITTLLTTKRGRIILREVTNIALELLENFVEEREKKSQNIKVVPEEIIEATEDVEPFENQSKEVVEDMTVDEASESNVNGNTHPKKRIFKGIRRSK